MSASTRKINFMISEETAREMESLVPPGQRSKVANEALQKELSLIRRKRTAERIKELRKKSPALKTEEIVSLIRRGRERK